MSVMVGSINEKQLRAVLWCRRLVTVLSSLRPKFNCSPVRVGFLVNRVALNKFSLSI